MSNLIDDVAAMTGLPRGACINIAKSAYKRYKVFEVPKKNGRGLRTLAQPAREVKAIQRALVSILEKKLPIHPSATAYRSGSSILENAKRHINSKFITKLDLQNFFPSIDRTSLGRHLRGQLKDLSPEEVNFVLSACCWKPKGTGVQRLCIGAPSSPLLSNSIMFAIDNDIDKLCTQLGAIYTRYSDDICISCERPGILGPIEQKIRDRIQANKWPTLVLNDKKRVAVGRGSAMIVTGITLSNQGMPTVGRDRKRGVRAGAANFLKGFLSEEEITRLKGEIAFVISIEPGFRFLLLRTYGDSVRPLLPRLFA